MLYAILLVCVHAVAIALHITGAYTIDIPQDLTQIQFFGLITLAFGVIGAIRLWLEPPKTIQSYLSFPLFWIGSFGITFICVNFQHHLLPLLNTALNASQNYTDLVAMLGFVTIVSIVNFLKCFMNDTTLYDTKLSKLFRMLPLSVSTLIFSLGMQFLLAKSKINFIHFDFNFDMLLVLWVSITAFVAIVMFVDKLPKSSMSAMAHMAFFVISFIGMHILWFQPIQDLQIDKLMNSSGFVGMLKVFAEFLMIGMVYIALKGCFSKTVVALPKH